MATVRAPAVAGFFYPASRTDLESQVRGFLETVPTMAGDPPKGVIAPHAGYVYSGPIAAHAYSRLIGARGIVKRVVLLGPTHRVAVRGLAIPTVDAFETPLGRIPLDRDALAESACLAQVVLHDGAHASEHSLEVQLPFLQTVLGAFSLAPFAVGDATTDEVAEVIDLLWGGPETLIVVSSDLSHYLSYDAARRTDRDTVEHILALDPRLDHFQACGATPVNGLLKVARRRGLAVNLLDLRNSGDTAGDHDRVVGYAAVEFAETALA